MLELEPTGHRGRAATGPEAYRFAAVRAITVMNTSQ